MQLCPHCHTPVDVERLGRSSETSCPACGHSLVRDAASSRRAARRPEGDGSAAAGAPTIDLAERKQTVDSRDARRGDTVLTASDTGRQAEKRDDNAAGLRSAKRPNEAIAREAAWPEVPGYQIVGRLGRGGMGEVYRARQVKLKRLVALKMIRGGDASDEEIARFRIEAQAVARLQHPGIVQIYEIGEHAGSPFLALELVEGPTLSQKLQGEPQPPRAAAEMVEKICRAIDAAHQKGIVHRDLKPANILLAANDAPKVTDFGLARFAETDSGQTKTGQIMGTPSYMAPEQAAGRSREIGPLADVYALGAILYEMLTGRPPFKGASPLDTLEQVRTKEPLAPSQLVARTPRDLETICLKCLQKDPRKRYADAKALAEDLRRWRTGEPIHARPVGALERAWRWCKRKPLAASFLLTLVLGIATTSGLAVWADSSRQFAEQKAADEANAKRQTEAALGLVEQARNEETRQKILKEKELARAKSLIYCLQINDAHQELLRGDLIHSRQILEETDADLRGPEYGYLADQLDKRLRTLAALNTCYDIALTKDGKQLYWGTDKGEIKVLDLELGKESTFKVQHQHPIRKLVLGPDGSRLCSMSDGPTLKVSDRIAQKEIASAELGSHCLALSPDGKRLYVGCHDHTIRVWDVEAGKPTATLRGHTGHVFSLAVSASGRVLYSGSADKTVKVWDLQREQERQTLTGHTELVSSLAVSGDDRWLFSGSQDETIKVWDLQEGKPRRTLGANVPVACIALRPRRLYAGCANGSVKIWEFDPRNMDEFRETMTLRGHTNAVSSLAVGGYGDGQQLYTASQDGTINFWNLEATAASQSIPALWPTCLAVSPDGKRIYAGSRDHSVRTYDPERTAEQREPWPDGHIGAVYSLALSTDGKRLYSGSADKSIKVWDVDARREIQTLPDEHVVLSLALSRDGKRLYSGTNGGPIRGWDVEKGTETLTLGEAGQIGRCLTLSGDEKRLFAVDREGAITVWDLETRKAIVKLQGQAQPATCLLLGSDGKRLVSGSRDETIRVWDVEHMNEPLKLTGHTGNITSLAISRDGKRLFSASDDKTIRIWDLELGKTLLTLRGHEKEVHGLALSPDETRLISFGPQPSTAGTIMVWKLAAAGERR